MTVRQESNRKEREEASNRARERAVIDVIGLPVANDEDWLESVKSNLLEKNKERREDTKGNLNQRIPKKQDVEYVLKKRSHKDTLAKKHTNSKTATKASKSPFDNKSVSEIQNILKKKMREENESCHSSEKHKIVSISEIFFIDLQLLSF